MQVLVMDQASGVVIGKFSKQEFDALLNFALWVGYEGNEENTIEDMPFNSVFNVCRLIETAVNRASATDFYEGTGVNQVKRYISLYDRPDVVAAAKLIASVLRGESEG